MILKRPPIHELSTDLVAFGTLDFTGWEAILVLEIDTTMNASKISLGVAMTQRARTVFLTTDIADFDLLFLFIQGSLLLWVDGRMPSLDGLRNAQSNCTTQTFRFLQSATLCL